MNFGEVAAATSVAQSSTNILAYMPTAPALQRHQLSHGFGSTDIFRTVGLNQV